MINNIDTGDGRVKFSYRIIVVVSDADPISRMMDSLKANEKLTKWAAGHRMTLTTKFLYKIDTNMLFLETLDIVEKFKQTFDGKESRDFIYIDDAVDATILALEKREANHQIFNVGSGVATSVFEVANILKKLYNSNIGIKISGKYRLGDIRHNYADLTKIKSVLDFKPKIDLITGVSRFVAWAKTQKVNVDKYEASIEELKQKGLIK